jgi:hypothetical protein
MGIAQKDERVINSFGSPIFDSARRKSALIHIMANTSMIGKGWRIKDLLIIQSRIISVSNEIHEERVLFSDE